jgi:hypothetical protein
MLSVATVDATEGSAMLQLLGSAGTIVLAVSLLLLAAVGMLSAWAAVEKFCYV